MMMPTMATTTKTLAAISMKTTENMTKRTMTMTNCDDNKKK
jgi:hypothetical protein